MNNNQEIERMAKIIADGRELHYPIIDDCQAGYRREARAKLNQDFASNELTWLCEAGIGDKKQAVKEAFEKLTEDLSWGKPIDDIEYVIEVIKECYTELYGADE